MASHAGPSRALQPFRGQDTPKTPWILSINEDVICQNLNLMDLPKHLESFILARHKQIKASTVTLYSVFKAPL
jgi:hypothetical protein